MCVQVVLILAQVTGTPALFLFCFCTVRVTPKMTESVNDLLKKLTDAQEATQRQLTELQQQVTSSQATSTKLVVQKIEEERGYTFRKKGHEKQWRFNKAVDSHMDNALDELKIPRSSDEKTAKIMDNVQEELEKGREEIADRQKRLKWRIDPNTVGGWWKHMNATNLRTTPRMKSAWRRPRRKLRRVP